MRIIKWILGLLVVVLADDVLAEKAVSPVIRRGGKADQVGVEILDYLPP